LAPVHVPFQGNPAVITALLGGQIQMALVPPGLAMPQVKAGKLKAIGLTGGRSALVPEVAPLADAGVRDFSLEVWTALVGPSNLSPAAQARLNAEVPAILRQSETQQKLLNQGWQAVGSSPEGLTRRVQEEGAAMQKIIGTQGVRLE
jgi:tripartite-type tricarboxylate transporter receptor subunit TctC